MVLGFIGSAVGGIFGGPIGSTIGGFLGNLVGGGNQPKVQDAPPNLQDAYIRSKIQSMPYGKIGNAPGFLPGGFSPLKIIKSVFGKVFGGGSQNVPRQTYPGGGGLFNGLLKVLLGLFGSRGGY